MSNFPSTVSWKYYTVNLPVTGNAISLGSGQAQTLAYSAFLKSNEANTNITYIAPASGANFWTLSSGDSYQIPGPGHGKFDLNQWWVFNSGVYSGAQVYSIIYL